MPLDSIRPLIGSKTERLLLRQWKEGVFEIFADINADLHESKEPVLITEHGQPSAYLIYVMRSERMLRKYILEDRELWITM